jgi:CheY-like chemotaxis protein
MAVIFVVDDYEVHRDALRSFLRRRGHEVVTAGDGAEALEQLKGWRPDLIVLDLWMPNVDGLAVLAALRESAGGQAPCPVIVTTAMTDGETLRRATELGARQVLLKTHFSLAGLAAEIVRELPGAAGEDGAVKRSA